MAWLPPEIMLLIISHTLDPATLVSLRLVNKDWSAAAAWQMDRILLLLNMSKLTQDTMEKKRKDPQARDLVRGVVVDYPDSDYWHTFRGESDRIKIDGRIRSFERLSFFFRAKVGQFPNLDFLTLHIRPPTDLIPIPHLAVDKDEILQGAADDLLKALKKLGKAKRSNNLDALSIQCLPIQVRFPGAEDGESESFKRAITKLRLKTLKIGLVSSTVWNRDPDWTSADQHFGDPPWFWVESTTMTLRNLSITCWGFYIRNIAGAFCHAGFSFPFLESLELRGCGFTADFQLNWIIRHGRTLRSLKFDDCAIVHRLVLWPQPRGRIMADHCHASLRIVDDGPRDKVRLYNSRWAQYFDRMKNELPQLKHFEMGSSRVRAPGEEGPSFKSEVHDGPPFNKPPQFLFGLFPDRYLKMSEVTGCPCCSWMLQNVKQQRPKRQGLILDNPDRDALRKLLQKIGQSVQEDTDSDHSGYVRGLMGRVKAEKPYSSEDSSSEGTSGSTSFEWESFYSDKPPSLETGYSSDYGF